MSDFFLVRPIVLWPEAETGNRVRSPFKSSYTATKNLLYREIGNLGASSAVLQLAVTEADIRLDGDLRANARPTHPGVIVSFESRHGSLRYACDRYLSWQDNVRAIARSRSCAPSTATARRRGVSSTRAGSSSPAVVTGRAPSAAGASSASTAA